MRILFSTFVLALLFLNSCAEQEFQDANNPYFHESKNPSLLSEWNILRVEDGALIPNDGVVPYDLNTPLFSDYAKKFRTIWIPDSLSAAYHSSESFDFPPGTIISKTFYYKSGNADQVLKELSSSDDSTRSGLELASNRLIETRLLVRRDSAWIALPYVWNKDESEAVLKRTGDIVALELVDHSGQTESFPYIIPNSNQCAGCHATDATTRAIKPIGPKARHLNRDYNFAEGLSNQLDKWESLGYLNGLVEESERPRSAVWNNHSESLKDRARAYLDINCSHCHKEGGSADTSGLHFEPETEMGVHLGKCKLPIAAGSGTGGRLYDIVPGEPDKSIMMYRLTSTDPADMMPELGRSTSHDEGVALLREWVASLEGECQ